MAFGAFQALFVNMHREQLRKVLYLSQVTSPIHIRMCEPVFCPPVCCSERGSCPECLWFVLPALQASPCTHCSLLCCTPIAAQPSAAPPLIFSHASSSWLYCKEGLWGRREEWLPSAQPRPAPPIGLGS